MTAPIKHVRTAVLPAPKLLAPGGQINISPETKKILESMGFDFGPGSQMHGQINQQQGVAVYSQEVQIEEPEAAYNRGFRDGMKQIEDLRLATEEAAKHIKAFIRDSLRGVPAHDGS